MVQSGIPFVEAIKEAKKGNIMAAVTLAAVDALGGSVEKAAAKAVEKAAEKVLEKLIFKEAEAQAASVAARTLAKDGAGERLLFRFDTRSPAQIAEAGGFSPRGSEMNLVDHAWGNQNSGYVSTTISFDAAKNHAQAETGFIYTISNHPKGIDVNKALGQWSPYPNEQEIAVPHNIPISSIISHIQVP